MGSTRSQMKEFAGVVEKQSAPVQSSGTTPSTTFTGYLPETHMRSTNEFFDELELRLDAGGIANHQGKVAAILKNFAGHPATWLVRCGKRGLGT